MQIMEAILDFLSTSVGTAILTVSSIFVSLLAVYYTYRQVNLARQANLIQAGTQRSKFPFDCLAVEELFEAKILNRFLLTNADIQYVLRLPPEQQQEMISTWRKALDTPGQARLMIRGGTGLGKTREVLEFLKRYSQELPKDKKITVLIPRPDLDVPQELPNDLPLENLVLLINDLHLKYDKTRANLPVTAPENERFHTRLQRVVEFFEEKTKGYGAFRVIITVRSEPELWQRISPDEEFWKTFTVIDLPKLHSSKVGSLVDSVVNNIEDMKVDDNAKPVLAEKCDGTFGSIILYLKTEEKQGTKNISSAMVKERFLGVYRDAWEKSVDEAFIKPYPERSVILVALDILNQTGLPFVEELLLELASYLWRSPLPRSLKKWKIKKGILALETWIQNYNGLLYCPEAYFENRGDAQKVLPLLTTILVRMSRNLRLQRVLFNPTYNFGLQLLYRFFDNKNAVRVFERLLRLNPNNHAAYFQLAYAFFWEGHLTRAEHLIKKAILLDSSLPSYHTLHADALSSQGKLSESAPHYKTAIRLTAQWDASSPWIFYEYSNFLMTIGKENEAIEYLEQISEISQDHVSALCSLTLVLRKRGDGEGVKKYASKAIEITPWSVTGFLSVGRVYREIFKELTKAVEFFDSAEKLGNHHAYNLYEVYTERALTYIELDKPDLAQKDFKRTISAVQLLLKNCPVNPDAMYTLAFALLMIGKNKEAEKTLKKAKLLLYSPIIIEDWKERLQTANKSVSQDDVSRYMKILEDKNRTDSILLTFRKFVALKLSDFLTKRIGQEIEKRVAEQMSIGNLKAIRDQAIMMQKELQAAEIEEADEGIKVVMGGDQEVRYFEIDGKSEERAVRVLRNAIKKSQKLAAMKLQQMSGGLRGLLGKLPEE